ncbi:Rpn family recombination-promoting nuclease/putative transposase [Arachidicoccus terrestris]|uniref:Rpn family recombination-promoting nuclease/putative transposase n=1 Tax=Arachidicoccus terrestris TaxID=2875539 RepID=UPI001CC56691|nr:Rpn family recombination-promoting nuclease/putative transposase [Arachidicoccus terrestris]UAY55356.1 Rpn family recombination-promoting nuclease/putative transposase [Arachidicoccus terrestris]
MNDVPIFNAGPTSLPYAMYIDREGRLTSREVREDMAHQSPSQKENVPTPLYGKPWTPKQLSDLKKDMAFKLFLGDEKYKEEVAIPFHKAFWGHLTEITDLDLTTAPLIGSTLDARNHNPDVVWQCPNTGASFLTEMQRRRQEHYSQRISLYDGKLRSSLAKKSAKWDFDQVGVYVLGLANFKLNRQGPSDYLHQYVSLNPEDNSDMLTGRDWKMLADLNKAKKVKPETYTERYKWIYLLNNFHRLKKIPTFLEGGNFDKVIKIAKKINQTKMEEFMDFVDQLHRRDAEEEARQEGMTKGLAKGREEMMAKLKEIKAFISVHPKWGIKRIAAIFGVDEQVVSTVMPG